MRLRHRMLSAQEIMCNCRFWAVALTPCQPRHVNQCKHFNPGTGLRMQSKASEACNLLLPTRPCNGRRISRTVVATAMFAFLAAVGRQPPDAQRRLPGRPVDIRIAHLYGTRHLSSARLSLSVIHAEPGMRRRSGPSRHRQRDRHPCAVALGQLRGMRSSRIELESRKSYR